MLSCSHHQPRDWLLFNFFLLSLKHCVPQRESHVEQALPCHSPICSWARCPAQHSPTTPAHGKTRQMPTASLFGFTCFCHTTLPMAVSRKAPREPLSLLRCPGSQGKVMAALMFHLALHPQCQPASQMMRGIITGPRHREILMGLARISSPSTHAEPGRQRPARTQVAAQHPGRQRCRALPARHTSPATASHQPSWRDTQTPSEHTTTSFKVLNA